MQDAIYKKYPNLDPNQSVLIPIYFKAPFFDNILWLRMPAFIMKTHVTKLESQIQKIAADWICRDRSNAIENEFQSKANTTIPSAVLKKKSWAGKIRPTPPNDFTLRVSATLHSCRARQTHRTIV